MTQEELERLEALAKAATAGPWETDGWDEVTASGPDGGVVVLEMPKQWSQGSEWTGAYSEATGKGDDLRFAAAARDAVPALVAEVRRLRGLVEAAYCEGYRDRHGKGDTELMDVEWDRSDARKALEGA